MQLAQLAIGVLGVLFITGEYSTGMIRATIGGGAEAAAGALGQGAGLRARHVRADAAAVLIAFFASQAILSRHHIRISRSAHPGVARAVIGAALYLTVVGVFALGARRDRPQHRRRDRGVRRDHVRDPAALNVLPQSWNDAISPYLPSNAGTAVIALTRDSTTLAPWTGFALFAGYALLALAIAAVLFVRRDA